MNKGQIENCIQMNDIWLFDDKRWSISISLNDRSYFSVIHRKRVVMLVRKQQNKKIRSKYKLKKKRNVNLEWYYEENTNRRGSRQDDFLTGLINFIDSRLSLYA